MLTIHFSFFHPPVRGISEFSETIFVPLLSQWRIQDSLEWGPKPGQPRVIVSYPRAPQAKRSGHIWGHAPLRQFWSSRLEMVHSQAFWNKKILSSVLYILGLEIPFIGKNGLKSSSEENLRNLVYRWRIYSIIMRYSIGEGETWLGWKAQVHYLSL